MILWSVPNLDGTFPLRTTLARCHSEPKATQTDTGFHSPHRSVIPQSAAGGGIRSCSCLCFSEANGLSRGILRASRWNTFNPPTAVAFRNFRVRGSGMTHKVSFYVQISSAIQL